VSTKATPGSGAQYRRAALFRTPMSGFWSGMRAALPPLATAIKPH